MRKYICDNCGAEFDDITTPLDGGEKYTPFTGCLKVKLNLQRLQWQSFDGTQDFGEPEEIGEYCEKCKGKIEARIREGIS